MPKIKYSAEIRPEWRKDSLGPTDLFVFGYLISAVRVNMRAAERRAAKGIIETNHNPRIVYMDVDAIWKCLTSERKVGWKNKTSAKNGISRAMKKLEAEDMIQWVQSSRRNQLVEVLWNELTGSYLVASKYAVSSQLVASKYAVSSQESYLLATKESERALPSNVESESAENYRVYVSKDMPEAQKNSLLEPLGDSKITQGEVGNPVPPPTNEIDHEVQHMGFFLTNWCNYGILKGKVCENLIDLKTMKRDTTPQPLPEAFVLRLQDYIIQEGEKHAMFGGLDNAELNLPKWLNHPLHSMLVAPNLNEHIKYQDMRDMPKSLKTLNTFKKFDWVPVTGSRAFNLLAFPGLDIADEYCETNPDFFVQPFNNPYLTPDTKGLAFIRMFPFGWHARDTWVHPWSPPVIPWAVVADNEALMKAWDKRYYYSGFHPFAPDKTTLTIRNAIRKGNREIQDDPIFNTERFDSLKDKPNVAGARTSMIADPSSFHVLHWICGTFGISPSRLITAFEMSEQYGGKFLGLSLTDATNQNADKIRIFLLWLKQYLWGNKTQGSWIPREGGAQKSLHSGIGQEWSHQGVLGGYTVLVDCYDGQSREVFLNEYQKRIYDLKFNPKNERETEILDSLLEELV